MSIVCSERACAPVTELSELVFTQTYTANHYLMPSMAQGRNTSLVITNLTIKAGGLAGLGFF
jgi:hypothetical protein